MRKKAFDDFDSFAADYRKIHNESIASSGADSDYFSEQKIEEVRRLESVDKIRVLDLGCGDGNSAVHFRKHFPDITYTGVDTSQKSIEVARSRGTVGASFEVFDGFALPFEDGDFDVVFIACVLHHVEHAQHEKLLREVRRVLATGGRIYVFEHNPLNPVTRKVVANCPFDDDAVLLSSSYTKRLLGSVGFGSIAVDFTIFFPRTALFRSLLPLENRLRWLPLGGQYFAKAVKN